MYIDRSTVQGEYSITSEHAWETVKTIDWSTVQGKYSMTLEHAWETIETIDCSTVCFCGPFENFRKQYTVISYVIWEQSNCWPKVKGIVSVVCFWPRAKVQNTISDTEGQLLDCSKIPYEITVLLPDQLKKKEEVYSLQIC